MLAVVQARMSSTRLPGKVLTPLGDASVLGWVVRAGRGATGVDEVAIATSVDPSDDPIVQEAESLGVEVLRGDLDDVVSRFVLALDRFGDQPIVRLTGDCPLLDPAVITLAASTFRAGGLDYVSTVLHRTLPRGLDVEVIGPAALRQAAARAQGADRAHVTSYVWRRPQEFRLAGLVFAPPADDLRVTLDEPDDLLLLQALVEHLGTGPHAWHAVVGLLREQPELAQINAHVQQKDLSAG